MHRIDISHNGWLLHEGACRNCGGNEGTYYRIIEDDEGHEDFQYYCDSCETTWYIDGIDS